MKATNAAVIIIAGKAGREKKVAGKATKKKTLKLQATSGQTAIIAANVRAKQSLTMLPAFTIASLFPNITVTPFLPHA